MVLVGAECLCLVRGRLRAGEERLRLIWGRRELGPELVAAARANASVEKDRLPAGGALFVRGALLHINGGTWLAAS